MPLKEMQYQDARPLMKPGDVIAFAGKTWVSQFIKWSTRSEVSHVGVILQTRALGDPKAQRFFNLVVESTQWEGFIGVDDARLSDRLDGYQGEVWWLPLSEAARGRFDETAFFEFIYDIKNRPFDLPQAIQAAIDFALRQSYADPRESFRNQEDLSRLFCSEMVAGAMRAAGLVGRINASEVTPVDLCQWALYQDTYYQIKKADPQDPLTEIKRCNTVDPATWVVQAPA